LNEESLMFRIIFEYARWLFLITKQQCHGLKLRWMVSRYPEEARRAAVRARWFGTQNQDVALLNGAEIIERLLAKNNR